MRRKAVRKRICSLATGLSGLIIIHFDRLDQELRCMAVRPCHSVTNLQIAYFPDETFAC